MPHAQFTVDLPTDSWLGRLADRYPATDVTVVSAFGTDDCAFDLDVSGGSGSALVSTMEELAAVRDVEVLSNREESVSCIATVAHDPVVTAAADSLAPIRFPVEVQDRSLTLQVAAPRRRLSTFGERLDTRGVSWTVDWIGESPTSGPTLTSRQRDLLQAACAAGYYDTPRECTLTELASDLDVAKSTCSETLHRAESKVMKYLFGTRGDADRVRLADSTGDTPTAVAPFD